MKTEMKNNLNGVFWEIDNIIFSLPNAENTTNAIRVFKKNIVSITWNCMSSLEKNPTTLPQTETILKGQSVSGISIDQLEQVKNFGDRAHKLIQLLSTDSFKLNEESACAIHAYVGKEEALSWGKFRDSDIAIRNVNYTPPKHDQLSNIAKKGFTFINEKILNPQEASIACFLFMSRSQFFHDANKRTAALFMNGVLIKNGYFPISIMNRDSEEFHTKLSEFYDTGNATEMMRFFEKTINTLY